MPKPLQRFTMVKTPGTIQDVHQGRQGHRGAEGQFIVGDLLEPAVIVNTAG